MQNSNLSSKIFPIIKDDWSNFIKKVEDELQQLMNTYTTNKRRLKDLERLITKLKEISNISKDNVIEILNYKELFMYIDNSLESSFNALKFFKDQDNLDNVAVKEIYERIVASPKIIKINSEYNSLLIKIGFDEERIKRFNELIRGSKVDFTLIRELLNKYKLDDKTKKNILFYPTLMMAIRQTDVKDNKEVIVENKEEKAKFYQNRFSELVNEYQKKKNELKDLLIHCFNIRKNMNKSEIDMYSSYANNIDELNSYEFNDDIKTKIVVLAFFKIKKDIESYIDGISDLQMEKVDLDSEIVFFCEMIDEFNHIANLLNEIIKVDEQNEEVTNNNVYFALDAFNRLIINKDLLVDKNKSSIKALFQKADSINNARIEGVKTNPVLGVEDEEKLIGKTISMITTSRMKLAYIVVNKNILIITGVDNSNERFDRLVKLAVNKNLFAIKNQIALIESEDVNYIELQNQIIDGILGDKEENKTL